MRWYIGLLVVLSLIVPQSFTAHAQTRDRQRLLRITEHTRNTTIRTDDASKNVELRVSVTGGTRPYTYTWYEGAVGDTSTQVGTRDRLKVALAHGTYTYWAEVEDSAGATVSTRTITIAIVPRTVGPLSIRKQPQSKEVERTGATTSVELEVSAIGGTRPYTYTWYAGVSGDTTTMVDEGDEITVALATGVHSFWAEVTDSNGDTVNSQTAVITVVSYPLAIVDRTLDQTIIAYDATAAVELEIEADGGTEPYTYTWYQGALGDTSTVIGNNDEVEIARAPATYTFWAEVTDSNGDTVTSDLITIDVVNAPLEFTREPRSTTAQWRNGSARTTVSAAARGGTAPLTYEWFLAGVSVGTGASLPVVFTNAAEAPRSYSVVVTDAAGDSITSRAATVRISLPPFTVTNYTRTTNARWVNGNAVASVFVRISGGVGPFTYTWYAGTRNNPGPIVASGPLVNGYAVAQLNTGATTAGRKNFFVAVRDAAGTVKYAQSYTVVTIPRPPVIRPTATPSATPEPTATPSATPEPTATPSATPEPTATPSATPEPTATPSATPEPTATPSETP